MVSRNDPTMRTVPFSKLEKWSAHDLVFQNTTSRYPMVTLSKVLRRVKEPVQIVDECSYRRITVRLYGQGVLQRDEVPGREIGTKRQFVAHAGQLILSRIDARNGAFGIVPAELEGAIVTNDFWLFEVRHALPQYLMLLLSSEIFQRYWQTQSSGTTNRQRVNEEDFLASMVALPELAEQERLLAAYNGKVRQAGQVQQAAEELERGVDGLFFQWLKVPVPERRQETGSCMGFCQLQDLQRWDLWNSGVSYASAEYKSVPFGQLTVGKPMYGANEKAIKTSGEVRYIRITDIREDGSLKDQFVTAKKVEEKYLLEENDFLLARSGSVGRGFLYHEAMGKAIFAGYLVKYRLNLKKVEPEYLLFYTQTELFKSWVRSHQHTTIRSIPVMPDTASSAVWTVVRWRTSALPM